MADTTTQVTNHNPVDRDLQASEIRYRRLFESARDGILILDVASRKITDVNPFMVKLLGYSRDEFLGKELWEIGLFKDKEQNQAAFRELQEKGYIRYDNMPLETKTGERREVEFVSNVYTEDDRQVIQCNTRDNTEHKRVDEELVQSREWLLAIFEASQDGIIVEENGQIVYVNNRFLRMYGYSSSGEVAGNHPLRFQNAAEAERIAEYGRKRLRGEAAPSIYEFTGVSKDGREMTIEASISTFNSNGKFYVVAAQRDITERQRLKEALYASRQMLLAVLDSIPQRVFWKNRDLVYQGCNLSFALDMGFAAPAEVVGKTDYDATWKAEAELYRADDRAVIESGIPKLNYLEPQTKPDGESGWLKTSKVLLRDRDGKVAGVLGTYEDSTERQRLEDELRQSEANLAAAQRIAHIGSWDTDLQNDRLFWSDEVYEIFEMPKAQFGATLESFYSTIHPEDVPSVQAAAEAALYHGAPYNLEHRIITQAGVEKIVCELGEVTFDESGKPLRMTGTVQDITERKRVEQELRNSEERYRDLIENAHDIIYTHDLAGNYTSVNRAGERITGYTREESLRMNLAQIVAPDYLEKARQIFAKNLAGEEITGHELVIIAKDGRRIAIEVNTRNILADGVPVGVQGIARDVTERRQLEEQLHQSQKLESVGRLAGGIAHDFNNMLTAINGYSQLTLRRLKAEDPLRYNIEEIMKAGERSAALTRQLLAFSRQQILLPVVLELNDIITDTVKLLQRLIGEDVQLITALSPKSGWVKVDPGQLSQIIINLAVNARDAMPQGGKLTIETSNVFFDPAYSSQHVGFLPGAYVMLSVSDTGTGMSAKTQEHIFEPFFTTKEVGQGTGLGLATVYGIVKQSGGQICVYSEEGVGTAFKIYLPRVIAPTQAAETVVASDALLRGTETILLVEDEEMVRGLSRHILEECGYTVLEARNGVEALSLCEQHDCQIELLMTDVVMPQMGGRELAEKFAHIYPQMQILFTSGYTDDAVVRHGVIEAGTNFLQKPFMPHELARKVREILDKSDGAKLR